MNFIFYHGLAQTEWVQNGILYGKALLDKLDFESNMKEKHPDKALKPVTTESGRCDMEGMLQTPEMPRDPCEEVS